MEYFWNLKELYVNEFVFVMVAKFFKIMHIYRKQEQDVEDNKSRLGTRQTSITELY